MNISLIAIIVIFFAVAYFSKRKYGLPALALVSGSIISTYWASYITASLQQSGIVLISPPLSVVVAVSLILLPGLVMLSVGPTYSKKYQRLLSALLLSLLGGTLCLITIANIAPELVNNDTLIQQGKALQPIIVVGAIVGALADAFIHHMPKKSKGNLH